MIRRTLEFRSEREVLAAERAIALVRELEDLADATPDGRVLSVVEEAAVDHGRRFLRERLEDVLNARADDLEKKGGAAGPAPAAGVAGATARPPGTSSPPRVT